MRNRFGVPALPSQVREVASQPEMYDDPIFQRGFAEALACRDMLTPAPVKPSPQRRMVAWVIAGARSLRSRELSHQQPTTPNAANVAATP